MSVFLIFPSLLFFPNYSCTILSVASARVFLQLWIISWKTLRDPRWSISIAFPAPRQVIMRAGFQLIKELGRVYQNLQASPTTSREPPGNPLERWYCGWKRLCLSWFAWSNETHKGRTKRTRTKTGITGLDKRRNDLQSKVYSSSSSIDMLCFLVIDWMSFCCCSIDLCTNRRSCVLCSPFFHRSWRDCFFCFCFFLVMWIRNIFHSAVLEEFEIVTCFCLFHVKGLKKKCYNDLMVPRRLLSVSIIINLFTLHLYLPLSPH